MVNCRVVKGPRRKSSGREWREGAGVPRPAERKPFESYYYYGQVAASAPSAPLRADTWTAAMEPVGSGLARHGRRLWSLEMERSERLINYTTNNKIIRAG